MSAKMHYFRAVKGRAFRRPGTDSFIGARRTPKGFIINTDVVVRIPETEMLPYRKDYDSAVRLGDLKRCNEADYKQYQDMRTKAAETAAKARKAEAKKAGREAEQQSAD